MSSEAATVFRLEGVAPSVRHRKASLTELLKPFGHVDHAGEAHSRALWKSVRDAKAVLGERAAGRMAAVARLDHAGARSGACGDAAA
jgi:glycolate oxidase FAD binding subunit